MRSFACFLLLACSSTSVPLDAGPSSDAPPPKPCTKTPVTPGDAFANARDPASMEVALARQIAERYMAVHAPESGAWNWTDAILEYSLIELWRVTGEMKYRDHAQRYLDSHLQKGYIITKSDACPPMLVAHQLARETCDPRYSKVVDDTLRYLYEVTPRTPEGAVSHLGTFTALGTTVWVDSLFMVGQPTIRYGELESDAKALDFYSTQYKFNIAKNQGPSGFFLHAWGWPGEQTPENYWARGNGWVLASAGDYLRARAARGESDPMVKDSFLKLVDATIKAQDPATGLYWTILLRPGDTYLETSATALFALGMARARRGGILGADVLPVITKAMSGVKSKIAMDPQGRPYVTGISAETDVGTYQDYASVPLKDDLHFGVGAVILALIEVSGLK